jgi:hypothetical protein
MFRITEDVMIITFFCHKDKNGICYHLFVKFRNNHHGYVLCHSPDELNNVRVPDLLQHSQLMPERVSATKKEEAIIVKGKKTLW